MLHTRTLYEDLLGPHHEDDGIVYLVAMLRYERGLGGSGQYVLQTDTEIRRKFPNSTVTVTGTSMFTWVRTVLESAPRFSAKRLAALVPPAALVAAHRAEALARRRARDAGENMATFKYTPSSVVSVARDPPLAGPRSMESV
jgi:hypothetical protein